MFFFSSRRRHTRCALVTWSSDVCSSDLITSPWKWRHLKSVIDPSVQSPPSMLKLHDFCNRARIKMGIGTGRCQDGVHIEALLLWHIVEMQMRVCREKRGRNRVEERRPRSCALTHMEVQRAPNLDQNFKNG